MEENPSVKPIGSAAPAGGQRSLNPPSSRDVLASALRLPSPNQLTTLSVLCDCGKFVKRKNEANFVARKLLNDQCKCHDCARFEKSDSQNRNLCQLRVALLPASEDLSS